MLEPSTMTHPERKNQKINNLVHPPFKLLIVTHISSSHTHTLLTHTAVNQRPQHNGMQHPVTEIGTDRHQVLPGTIIIFTSTARLHTTREKHQSIPEAVDEPHELGGRLFSATTNSPQFDTGRVTPN
jgi:hypothetical protein